MKTLGYFFTALLGGATAPPPPVSKAPESQPKVGSYRVLSETYGDGSTAYYVQMYDACRYTPDGYWWKNVSKFETESDACAFKLRQEQRDEAARLRNTVVSRRICCE